MNTIKALTIGAGLGLLIACGPQPSDEMTEGTDSYDTAPEPTTGVSESELPGNDQANDLDPITAQARVDDVSVGHSMAADGSIPAEEADDEFEVGEPVHLSMAVEDTPAGSEIEVVWLGPEDARIGDQQKTVEEGQSHLGFTTPDTTGWAPGAYKAEVWIGDEKVATERFQIVAAGGESNDEMEG
ncbi:MAG: hypothetical protein R2991_16660 [Thermoanaerobaculia bacterium]